MRSFFAFTYTPIILWKKVFCILSQALFLFILTFYVWLLFIYDYCTLLFIYCYIIPNLNILDYHITLFYFKMHTYRIKMFFIQLALFSVLLSFIVVYIKHWKIIVHRHKMAYLKMCFFMNKWYRNILCMDTVFLNWQDLVIVTDKLPITLELFTICLSQKKMLDDFNLQLLRNLAL